MSVIWSMTWQELFRKKVLLLTLLLTAVFLAAFWFIAQTLGGDVKRMSEFSGGAELVVLRFSYGALLLMLGFFFGSFVIAFLAIFSSFSALAGEAEQGVLQALLPRPLPRWKWYIGRWLGYVSFGVLYALLLFAGIVWIAKFHTAVPADWWTLLKAFLLFSASVPLLVSVSMLGSGFMTAVGNGVLLTMLYGAGWLGGMIGSVTSSLRLEPAVETTLQNVTGVISLIMPSDGLQRKMIAELLNLDMLGSFVNQTPLGLGGQEMGTPSGAFVVYAMIYTAVMLFLGTWRFRRKDF